MSTDDRTDYILSLIPERSIVTDLKNSILILNETKTSLTNCKTKTLRFFHNFSNICGGKILYPNALVGYQYANDEYPKIDLYGGGFGHGYYHNVYYNIHSKQYEYTTGDTDGMRLEYASETWEDMHTYVTNYCKTVCGTSEQL